MPPDFDPLIWLSHPPILGRMGTAPPPLPRGINSILADPYSATPETAGASINTDIAKLLSAVHACRIRNTLQGSINGYASI